MPHLCPLQFGSQIQQLVLKRLPPRLSLQITRAARPAARHGYTSILVTLARDPTPTRSCGSLTHARLIVGTTHNDSLLFRERLVLETFSSPLELECAASLFVKDPQTSEQLTIVHTSAQVVAYLMFEDVVGVDLVEKLHLGEIKLPPPTPALAPKPAWSRPAGEPWRNAQSECAQAPKGRGAQQEGSTMVLSGQMEGNREAAEKEREKGIVNHEAATGAPPPIDITAPHALHHIISRWAAPRSSGKEQVRPVSASSAPTESQSSKAPASPCLDPHPSFPNPLAKLPPPQVPWEPQGQHLRKLSLFPGMCSPSSIRLVPSHQATHSCTAADVAAPAVQEWQQSRLAPPPASTAAPSTSRINAPAAKAARTGAQRLSSSTCRLGGGAALSAAMDDDPVTSERPPHRPAMSLPAAPKGPKGWGLNQQGSRPILRVSSPQVLPQALESKAKNQAPSGTSPGLCFDWLASPSSNQPAPHSADALLPCPQRKGSQGGARFKRPSFIPATESRAQQLPRYMQEAMMETQEAEDPYTVEHKQVKTNEPVIRTPKYIGASTRATGRAASHPHLRTVSEISAHSSLSTILASSPRHRRQNLLSAAAPS